MHIPTHMIQGSVAQISAAGSAAGVAAAAWFAVKAKEKPAVFRFAAVTALIFAAQMMNFPVQSGTSGHLIGATLAVMLLGVPHAVLSMSIVLVVQCLAFADGGLDVLGVNILNMAVLAVIPGAFAVFYLKKGKGKPLSARFTVIAFSSWFSVVMAAFACSVELAAAGTISASAVIPAMTGVHAMIGVGEALITVAAVFAFGNVSGKSENTKADLSGKKAYREPLVAAAVIALILSPFASSYPDGLEWVAQKYGFLHESMPLFVSPLPDYSIPFISNEILSTSFAGITGTLIVFIAAYAMGSALNPKKVKAGIGG